MNLAPHRYLRSRGFIKFYSTFFSRRIVNRTKNYSPSTFHTFTAAAAPTDNSQWIFFYSVASCLWTKWRVCMAKKTHYIGDL